MKYTFIAAMLATCALTLVACGKKEEKAPEPAPAVLEPAPVVPAEPAPVTPAEPAPSHEEKPAAGAEEPAKH